MVQRLGPLAGDPSAGDPLADDPLASAPPAFADEAARQILNDGFGVMGSLTALAGERDQNFRVDTAAGQRFLFKISNPADTRPVLDMQTAALRHIERVDPGLPVMRAIPCISGDPWTEVPGPDGRTYPVRLFTFLPGRTMAATALSAGALRSIGQTTARVGRALRGFFHPAADYEILWDITRLPALRPMLGHVPDAARRAQVARVIDRFEAQVAPVLPGLRAQVIHADLSLNNLLLGEDLQVSGIVDFGDMTHAPLVCDLAVAIADVLHGRDDAIGAAEDMIAGYVAVTPLDDEEAGLLADLVAARLATDITLTTWRLGVYPDNAAYAADSGPVRPPSWTPSRPRGWTRLPSASATLAGGCRTAGPRPPPWRNAGAGRCPGHRCSTTSRCIWSAARAPGCSTPVADATSTATTTSPWSATATPGWCAPWPSNSDCSPRTAVTCTRRSSNSLNGSRPPCRPHWTP